MEESMYARDIMDTRFHTLHPEMSIAEAVTAFQRATQILGKKVFGMIVIDDADQLVGMLSMYDILNYVQPRHAAIIREMEDLDHDQAYKERLKRIRSIRVDDIMSTDLITVSPDTHLMTIAQLMITKHIRRLPVVEDGSVKGIVYVSDTFYKVMTLF